MNELLQHLREVYSRRRKNRRILEIMTLRTLNPEALYSPTDTEIVTLAILDITVALRDAKNNLEAVFEKISAIMDRRADVRCFYQPFIVARDRIAVTFCGNEADRRHVIAGGVEEYCSLYPSENPLDTPIVFGIANDLEAVHMAMQMRREHKEDKEEFDRDLAGSIGKMLVAISEWKLWASSLMEAFLVVAESTKDMRWQAWHEVRNCAGVHRIPENVRAVIGATDIRGLSALPLERQAAYVYRLFERSVQEELMSLLEKQGSISRDDRFRLYALQLVIEQDKILIGQDSTDVF